MLNKDVLEVIVNNLSKLTAAQLQSSIQSTVGFEYYTNGISKKDFESAGLILSNTYEHPSSRFVDAGVQFSFTYSVIPQKQIEIAKVLSEKKSIKPIDIDELVQKMINTLDLQFFDLRRLKDLVMKLKNSELTGKTFVTVSDYQDNKESLISNYKKIMESDFKKLGCSKIEDKSRAERRAECYFVEYGYAFPRHFIQELEDVVCALENDEKNQNVEKNEAAVMEQKIKEILLKPSSELNTATSLDSLVRLSIDPTKSDGSSSASNSVASAKQGSYNSRMG